MPGLAHDARFGAVVTAMVTPFDEAGALQPDTAARLARWLVEHGTDALVVAGTTGEGPVLSEGERDDLFRAVAEAVTVPVIAGAGSNDTRHTLDLVRAATEAGVDAVLVVTPYYSRPSQRGIAEHFTAAAAATDLPVVLYDIPIRSGRRISRETLLSLAHTVPNVVGVKDSAGDPAATARLVAEAPAGFEVYCGDDALALPMLAVGATGVVSVASHWMGEEMSRLVAAYRAGDVVGAREANARLLESFRFESSEEWPNPLPAKALLRALGMPVGQCRLPLGDAPPELDRAAGELLRRLGPQVPVAAAAEGSLA